MLEYAYEAAGRAAAYLSEEIETSPFEYLYGCLPNYVKEGPGARKLRVDSFTDLCLNVFEGDLDRIRSAINGQGLGDKFWIVDGTFEGATDLIAGELEVPACAMTLRHGLGVVKEFSESNSSRIRHASVGDANDSILLEYEGGGRMEVRPMRFSQPTDKHRLLAEKTYKQLRARSGKPFADLSKIPGLKNADCIDHWRFGPNPAVMEDKDPRIVRDSQRVDHNARGPHLCIHPKGLALEFQEMWALLGGGKIRLSRCQEAVARYLDAKNWNQLIAIDPARYWLPVVISVGTDPGVTDQWESHKFYRNAKEGLAAFADFVDRVDVQEWNFATGIFRHCSLTVTAKFDDKYIQVRPFTAVAFDNELLSGCPKELFNPDSAGLSEAVGQYLNIGLSRDEEVRRNDEEMGSTTLLLPGLKVRRVPASVYREYVVIDMIREDGSRLWRNGDARTDDTYLLHHDDDNTYEIVFKQSGAVRYESGGIFDDDLTEEQKGLLTRIFRNTGSISCETLEDILTQGRRELTDKEISRRRLGDDWRKSMGGTGERFHSILE